ncbi:TetR/AcrR family transcriptional regulator [Mycolicibacterium vaccae]|uniref:TetR/AcrR family transcriptional regulator n=1 Tax=Mycolicibacterium vaccae TaxID=1810 RepID=UPI003D0503DB
MPARGRSADPRAERVRARLRDAAFALAHERPVGGITVGDLVTRAQVSRQVFYRHFRDRDDAVAAAFSEAFAGVAAPGGPDARGHIRMLFDFAAEHQAFCRNIVGSAVQQHVVTEYRDALTAPCRQIAEQGLAVLRTVAALPAEPVTRFLVGGLTEVLRSWMDAPDATGLPARVSTALDTVDALLNSRGPADG